MAVSWSISFLHSIKLSSLVAIVPELDRQWAHCKLHLKVISQVTLTGARNPFLAILALNDDPLISQLIENIYQP